MYSKKAFENLLNKYKTNYEIESNRLIELKNILEETSIEMFLFSKPFENFDFKNIQSINNKLNEKSKEIEKEISQQTEKVTCQKNMFNRLLVLYKEEFGEECEFKSIK